VFRPRSGLVLLSALALLAGACSSGETKELDLAKAERSIRDLSERAYSSEAKVGAVRCPTRVVLEQGSVFTCTVLIDGEPLLIALRQKDDKGNVRIDQVQAVIFTKKVENFVASYASQNRSPASSVVCGSKPVATRSPGERFSCTVEFEDGTTGIAQLQVKDTDGKVGLQSLKPT
jgi:Domain of unknown function (DUF4333)